MIIPRHPFRLNIGFLSKQDVGTSRAFPFQFDRVRLGMDLDLENFSGQVEFTRTQQGLVAKAEFSAETRLECSRCLIQFPAVLETTFTELYAFPSKKTPETELVLSEDGIVDLEPLIREYLLLEIPINPHCQADCKGLCPVCGENRNENPCDHETDDVDPRLSILRNLTLD